MEGGGAERGREKEELRRGKMRGGRRSWEREGGGAERGREGGAGSRREGGGTERRIEEGLGDGERRGWICITLLFSLVGRPSLSFCHCTPKRRK